LNELVFILSKALKVELTTSMCSLFAIGLGTCEVSGTAPNLILDGGFEECNPSVGHDYHNQVYLTDSTCPDWTLDVGTSTHADGDQGLKPSTRYAHSGNISLQLGSGYGQVNGVSQVITGLVNGDFYRFTFWATSDNQFPNTIDVYFSGALIVTLSNTTTPHLGSFIEYSVLVQASSTTSEFALIGGDVPGVLYVDDLSLFVCAG